MPISAQDAHYWSSQYGANASLLGGVVVGSLLDLSDSYYNPGALALISDPSLVLGADAFEFIGINVKNGAGQGFDLSSLQVRPAPGFFGITLGRHWVLSSLTRHNFVLDVDARRIDSRQSLPDQPGNEAFASEALFRQNLTESWLGITRSHSLTSTIGIGVTQYLALRSQRGRFQVISQAVNPNGNGGAAIAFDEFRFWNVRLLWKAGILVDRSPLIFGLTLTTPSVDIYGRGSSLINTSLIGVDADGDGAQDSQLASNYQDKLRAHYRSSTAIAAGASYRYKGTKLHVSAEWFDSVGKFDVLDTSDFIAQTTGDTVSTQFTHDLRQVFNYGAGLEHNVNPSVSMYASVATDFSALTGSGDRLALASWDIYHVSAGSKFTVANVSVTFGVGYSFGSDEIVSDVDLGESGGDGPLPPPAVGQVEFDKWKLIVGFQVGG